MFQDSDLNFKASKGVKPRGHGFNSPGLRLSGLGMRVQLEGHGSTFLATKQDKIVYIKSKPKL